MSSQRIVDLRKGRTLRRPAAREPVRESERRSPLRTRRRHKRLLIVAACALAAIALTWGVRELLYLPRLSIQSIQVRGAERIAPEIVASYANSLLNDGRFHFFSRRNILLYPKSAIARAVPINYPRIAAAEVARDSALGTTLVITIKERQAYARWCAEAERCYFIDDRGFVFAEASDQETVATSYVFTGGLAGDTLQPIGSTFAPGHVPGLATMLRNLGEADYRPTGASVENDQDFFVYLTQGFFIKASYGQDAAQLVRNLDLILASDTLRGKEDRLEYIDLRFGNRVYYKMKGESEVSAE
jgi:cell division septal protein FtsQ